MNIEWNWQSFGNFVHCARKDMKIIRADLAKLIKQASENTAKYKDEKNISTFKIKDIKFWEDARLIEEHKTLKQLKYEYDVPLNFQFWVDFLTDEMLKADKKRKIPYKRGKNV